MNITTKVKTLHQQSVRLSMIIIEFGITTEVSEVHLANATSSINTPESKIVIEINNLYIQNEDWSIAANASRMDKKGLWNVSPYSSNSSDKTSTPAFFSKSWIRNCSLL